jgi:hypothetical protein
MKRFIVAILFTAIICSHTVAQQVDDSLRYAESIWSMKKKALILEEMDLTEAEKSAFWPVYESYASAIQFLDMDYLRLMSYTTEPGLKEKKLESLCEHLLENDLLLAKTRKQYYQKFRKALSPAQAGRFMQLDDEFRRLLRMEMQKQLPAAYVSSEEKIYSQN